MTAHFFGFSRSAGVLGLLSILAAGCSSVTPDGGFGPVSELAKSHLGMEARMVRSDTDQRALAASINEKLTRALNADDAVQIALLNNRSLQATYLNVGIAQADLVQAGRLRNPSFALQRTSAGGDVAIDRSLTFSLVSMLTMPLAKRIEGRRFEEARMSVANRMLAVAVQTRRAHIEAVAAVQGLDYARQVSRSAQASSELTGRMAQVGNASQLDLAREQAFYAETTGAVGRALQRTVATREKLTRLMGLWGKNTTFMLPSRLPDLPAAPAVRDDVEQIAMRDRFDIQAAKSEAAQTAASLGLAKTTRLVNVFDLGYVNNSDAGKPRARGYAISLELPLFDWGTSRVSRAEAIYMQSVHKVAQTAIDARSEARESYLGYRNAYDLAQHYRDEVIPLRKKVSDETLLRYNGMLVSVFELLADAREQASAVNSYIDALKEFWLAQADMEAALGGRLPEAPADLNQGSKQ
ncbi:TolC family protein [Massilia sp. TWP1-3-3]|uniref:TolC family protein n=1 Tax=Massilia sp. TWP1-3-3 TaxID=2804573 RepID=UPI003CF92B68